MNDQGYQGLQRPGADQSDFNAHAFLIRSLLGTEVRTATLVQIKAVTNAGELAPVGFVDVLPLVAQVDGEGRPMPHTTIYNLPYFRLQGGADAIILDPKVGDIGIAVFADRDISSVKTAKGQANPGSSRTFDMADGLYIGGVLNGTPQQYIRYYSGGIKVYSPTKIRLEAPEIELSATTSIKGEAPLIRNTATGSVEAIAPTILESAPAITLDGAILQGLGPNNPGAFTAHMRGPLQVDTEVIANTTPLHTHAHTNVSPGTSNTGGPTP